MFHKYLALNFASCSLWCPLLLLIEAIPVQVYMATLCRVSKETLSFYCSHFSSLQLKPVEWLCPLFTSRYDWLTPDVKLYHLCVFHSRRYPSKWKPYRSCAMGLSYAPDKRPRDKPFYFCPCQMGRNDLTIENSFFVVVLFCSYGDWVQGIIHIWQVFYDLTSCRKKSTSRTYRSKFYCLW